MKIINVQGDEYIILKKYTNFLLCQKIIRREKTCFSPFDLGLINNEKKCNGRTKWERGE